MTIANFQEKISPSKICDRKRINNNSDTSIAVGVFVHHRDVKVALCDLFDAGIPVSWVTLIARDCQHHEWKWGLTICDRFEGISNELSQEARSLIYRCFQQGRYLLKIKGTDDNVLSAKTIMSRPGHSHVLM